jgi:predicted homoserine dehydrogenase-like protein
VIIVDSALEDRHQSGNPIRVGMVGAGFMGRAIALQIIEATKGMELVAIANRTLEKAGRAFQDAGTEPAEVVEDTSGLQREIERGKPAITEDPSLLCRTEGIDAIVEVTGTVEFAAGVAVEAIDHGKHVVLMNAELDGTLGSVLKERADEAGVVITNSDGDQPGVIMNLFRFVRGIGVRPVLCGNIKGLHDPYRTPSTQGGFARRWGQNPTMVTSFADGTKISFEQAIVANATGMRVACRGMLGPSVEPGTPIQEAVRSYPLEELLDGPGIVDYVVGAEPSPGVFVLGTTDHPTQRHYLNLYKLGEGPLYCFYTPYHLCHFEVPNTIARAVLFRDATIAADGAPHVDVVTTAKVDLKAGESLDGIGGFKTYGLAENATIAAAQRLLPMGLAENCTVSRDIPRDAVLTYEDVDIPSGRLVDVLRREQQEHFGLRGAAMLSVLSPLYFLQELVHGLAESLQAGGVVGGLLMFAVAG